MKTINSILTITLFVFAMLTLNAQEKFGTYDNSYANSTYDLKIANSKNKFSLYIHAMSLDDTHKKGGILIEEINHPEFVKSLTDAKLKYQEWLKTAKENNVKELTKKMLIQSKADGFFLYGSEWNFQFSLDLSYEFKILELKGEIKNLLIIRTGELTSSSNKYMKVDGFVLVFSNLKEIDDFINKISAAKITEYLNKPKKEDLFKD